MDGEQKIHRSNVNSGEWIIIVVALGFIDILQVILDLIGGIGLIVNRVLDILVGGSFLLYLLIRGEFRNPKTRNRLILAFLITLGIEELPVVGEVSPTWTGDGLFCWYQSSETNKIAEAQEKAKAEMDYQMKMEVQNARLIKIQVVREQQAAAREKATDNELYEDAA